MNCRAAADLKPQDRLTLVQATVITLASFYRQLALQFGVDWFEEIPTHRT